MKLKNSLNIKSTDLRILRIKAAYLLLKLAGWGYKKSKTERSIWLLPFFVAAISGVLIASPMLLIVGGIGMIMTTICWAEEKVLSRIANWLYFFAPLNLTAIFGKFNQFFISHISSPPFTPPRYSSLA